MKSHHLKNNKLTCCPKRGRWALNHKLINSKVEFRINDHYLLLSSLCESSVKLFLNFIELFYTKWFKLFSKKMPSQKRYHPIISVLSDNEYYIYRKAFSINHCIIWKWVECKFTFVSAEEIHILPLTSIPLGIRSVLDIENKTIRKTTFCYYCYPWFIRNSNSTP